MCLHPHPIDPIPEETARVARAAFPKGNRSMRMRDELGVFYHDEAFAALFPARCQDAESPLAPGAGPGDAGCRRAH